MEDAASGEGACNSTRPDEVGRFGAVGVDWVVEREGVIISHCETKSPRQLNGLRPEHLEKTVFMDSTYELGLGRGGRFGHRQLCRSAAVGGLWAWAGTAVGRTVERGLPPTAPDSSANA